MPHPQTTLGPRQRLMASAITLVRQNGVDGTGLAELLEHSNSARRSIYQHFPAGKYELIEASTRAVGKWVQKAIREFGAVMDSTTLLTEMIKLISEDLVRSDYRLGCPVAAAGFASADATRVRQAAADVLAGTLAEIEALLVREGRTAAEARSLAGMLVSSVEGALMCARAAHSTEPLEQAAEHLTRLLNDS